MTALRFALAVGLILLWTGAVFAAAVNGFWRPAITQDRTAEGFVTAVARDMPEDFRGNLMLITLENGIPAARLAVGPEGAVPDGSSVFQIASLSKWVTATGVLTLVRDGMIGLDDPVQDHVTRWSLPGDPEDVGGVTIRRLLSHTAGLTDGLGYQGFESKSDVQSLESSLTQAADAMEGASGSVAIGQEPGRAWAYSGGGYTLLQLMIEEVTGESFAEAMTTRVLAPSGMTHSSFAYDDIKDRLALSYDATGAITPHRHYTALAAASLYTTADDLALFLSAVSRPSSQGGLLPMDLMQDMRAVHARQYGLPVWGLGTVIYVSEGHENQVIGHEGANFPATNTSARQHVQSGDGIVILATSSTNIASRIADDWTYWRTRELAITALPQALRTAFLVWAAGIVAVALLGLRKSQRAKGR
ncbi:serine hydrolase domain-containing protein [Yoonia sp.]|uniref:serine hydrolase domain-containing protein n=1 Tax=Yoonia sp. TaxID=2212373 RepID=UPI00358F5F14